MGGNIINKREAGNIIQSVAMAVAVTSNRVNHQSPEMVAWLDGFLAACGIIALGLGVPEHHVQRLNEIPKAIQQLDGFPEAIHPQDTFSLRNRNPNIPEGVRILSGG